MQGETCCPLLLITDLAVCGLYRSHHRVEAGDGKVSSLSLYIKYRHIYGISTQSSTLSAACSAAYVSNLQVSPINFLLCHHSSQRPITISACSTAAHLLSWNTGFSVLLEGCDRQWSTKMEITALPYQGLLYGVRRYGQRPKWIMGNAQLTEGVPLYV